MGNRRLGAQRLNALLKKGSIGTDSSYQAGAGISGAIKSHKMIRDGVFVITEIVLDLGTSSTDIRSGGVDEPIGTNSSTASAHLMLWENDVHGVLQSTETYVAEAVTTVTACSLAMGDNQAAISIALTNRVDVNAGFATSAKRVGAGVVNAAATDGKYIFLTGDDNADTTLDAGQLVIRFIGILSTEISAD